MKTLLIDIGNTSVKASVAEDLTLGKTFRYQGERFTDFIRSVVSEEYPEVIVVSSVRNIPQEDIENIRKLCEKVVVFDDDIKKEYGLPVYISSDRAASMIAVRHLFKGRSCTVFDFGSALSIDFVNSDGVYEGGNVSLGFRNRFKALNRYSRNIPLLSSIDDSESVGNSLKSSICSGIIKGMIFEVKGYLDEMSENIPVFTGGDAIFFAKRIKNSTFVVCNLVLMGLALIALKYCNED